MHGRAAAIELADYVRDYHGYSESGYVSLVRRELPHGGIVLIVNFGAAWDIGGARPGQESSRYSSFVAGIDDHASLVGATGKANCLQVNFTPLGARRFFGVAMDSLARQVVHLSDLIGVDANRLAERLYQAPDWPTRFDIAERTIAARIHAAPPAEPGLIWAWQALERSHGRLSIGHLAERLNCSRKHLAARFRDQIGMPPKSVAGILRFAHARRLIDAEKAPDLATVAQAAGYYDQAHFNRDFLMLTGITPSAYLRARLPDGGGLLA